LIESPIVNPGDGALRIGVFDLDSMRSRLLSFGINPGEITRVEGVVAKCEFKDPDGNQISLYQLL
jgi:Fe2+ transport system protein FeoA